MAEYIRRLPDSELEIMKIIWDAGGRVTSVQVLDRLRNKRDWKTTSVLTFLSRLADKGFLSVERQGKTNIYQALVDEQDYLEKESKSFLEKLCGNSLKTFVASLYDGKAISENDLRELRQYINEKTKEG
ncbi:Predicted transcriptional regulator [Sporobacter termitidis DSM 10068]|uniref:Predicted transcriptional regulator n=1 Tax=Sporobacter termitidis DSM 10068 TaxID=1123282 RepID=A0A1M5UG39_9FIRM|nr:BlaI/MecI/CopY family transcriptional regulator [Sporobacter termitidis]SHH61603.1 Predicted transcriptional regulator [Sporobacter termitidis DSM 10068]